MNNHNTLVVVNSVSHVVGGLSAAAFVLVLFILLVIILRAGTGIY
jgi:hypothetical protein